MRKETDSPASRVILADDNLEMRKTVQRLIEKEFDVVASVGDGRSLVDAVSRLKPGIGVIDICMPLMSGIEAVREIRRSGSSMKIVFLTVNEDVDFVTAGMAAGASAYVIKRNMVTDLLPALKEAGAGRTFISPCLRVPGQTRDAN